MHGCENMSVTAVKRLKSFNDFLNFYSFTELFVKSIPTFLRERHLLHPIRKTGFWKLYVLKGKTDNFPTSVYYLVVQNSRLFKTPPVPFGGMVREIENVLQKVGVYDERWNVIP